jgi:dsRNA-specific ribonuclease
MNNQKVKADPYNFSNKLVKQSDVIDILKKVNMNDFTPNNIELYQEAFIHTSYNFLEDYKDFEKPYNCLPLQ